MVKNQTKKVVLLSFMEEGIVLPSAFKTLTDNKSYIPSLLTNLTDEGYICNRRITVKSQNRKYAVTYKATLANTSSTPNELALNDVNSYIATNTSRHLKTSMKSVLERFLKAPYGFVEADIWWLIAKLFKDGDIAFFVNNEAIKSLISYAVGCMFGRYSLDIEGLAYAGGEWDNTKYSIFIPDADNCIPITDEEYFEDDIVGRFVKFIETVYGKDTLEENLDFIAKALGNKGNTSREVIRNYFLNDFIKDHIKIYQKRPIYWLYDSGKQNGFKALVYMHRYNADTTGNMRVEYLHRMQRVYEKEIERMQDTINNSSDNKEISAANKRKEKLQKQLKETKEYDAKVAHLALSRIGIDLDDGVKVNYEKVQTASDGTKLQILTKI